MDWSEEISAVINSNKEISVDVLKSLVSKFPYFQALRFKYVELLKKVGAPEYDDELAILATITKNRKVLFNAFSKESSDAILNEPVVKQNESRNLSVDPSMSIIDTFLSKDLNRIRPKMNTEQPIEATASIEVPDDLVSETLAKIYIKQDKLQEAEEVYKKLSLLEPEKSAYFARLIKDLKKKKE